MREIVKSIQRLYRAKRIIDAQLDTCVAKGIITEAEKLDIINFEETMV